MRQIKAHTCTVTYGGMPNRAYSYHPHPSPEFMLTSGMPTRGPSSRGVIYIIIYIYIYIYIYKRNPLVEMSQSRSIQYYAILHNMPPADCCSARGRPTGTSSHPKLKNKHFADQIAADVDQRSGLLAIHIGSRTR